MADPATSTFTGAIVAAAYTTATVLGFPLSVCLLAALGALFALAEADKLAPTPRNLASAGITLAISWVLGLYGGPIVGGLAIAPALKAIGSSMSPTVADPLAALVISMFGLGRLLPAVLQVMSKLTDEVVNQLTGRIREWIGGKK